MLGRYYQLSDYVSDLQTLIHDPSPNVPDYAAEESARLAREFADVDRAAESGLNRVELARADGKPLAQQVSAVRFLFKNGHAGFNVYREIVLQGNILR